MVVHEGMGAGSGHYYSVVRSKTATGAHVWLYCNDTIVRIVSEASAILYASRANMLFYEHVGETTGLSV
jgi:hypothetical protein